MSYKGNGERAGSEPYNLLSILRLTGEETIGTKTETDWQAGRQTDG